MDFIDQIRAIAARIPTQRPLLQTEEATKSALVLPFIMALGYDVFNPAEVMPELVADVGMKKGEKVDYAIMKDGKSIIIFECKKIDSDLSIEQASQLFRYYAVTEARFGVLTDGVVYRFFTDLEKQNTMDSKPFLEFNLVDFKEQELEELKKFTKSMFNLDNIISTASDLKYSKEIQRILAEQLASPSEEFVRMMGGQVYSGRMTQSVKDQFSQITKRAFAQFINDRVNERLKQALAANEAAQQEARQVVAADPISVGEVVTTAEEWEAFYIIRAILRELVDVKRIAIRDAKSYCAILFDDNNRRPICRLWLSESQKAISLFDTEKTEDRIRISDISEIYTYSQRLKATVLSYMKPKAELEANTETR